MPTYDYKCEKCGHLFEVFQSMKDERLTDCPVENCGGKVKRLLGTGAGIIFKGSGFYQTDYRSEGYKQAAKSDSGAAASGGGGSGSGGGDSSGGGSSTGGGTGSSGTPASGGSGSGGSGSAGS